MAKLIWGLVGAAAIVGAVVIFKPEQKQESINRPESAEPLPSMVDWSASFAIFTNGIFRVFTNRMYHNLSGDAYIEALNPNVVRVKKQGTTWADFFESLPFELTEECLVTGAKETFCPAGGRYLKFYLNGEEDAQALRREIRDQDKLLVSFG